MAAASLSLEGALARRRLADGAAVVVVHGRFAQSVPWLSRFIAAKAGQDSECAVLVSDKLPGDSADAPGVALLRLGTLPVAECAGSAAAAAAPSPLACVAAGVADCLTRRGAVALGSHDPATMPDVKVGVVFESVTTLLLAHPVAEVGAYLADLATRVTGHARASPVVLHLDAGVVGVGTVLALTSLASLVLRVDALPSATASEAGYLGGELVVTETLKSGKERSFTQHYSVHPNGSVVLGAATPAPPAAALMPVPVTDAAGSGGGAAAAAAASTAGSAPPGDAVRTVRPPRGASEPAAGTVAVHPLATKGAPGVTVDDDGRALVYFDAGDDAGDDDGGDGLDDDLDF